MGAQAYTQANDERLTARARGDNFMLMKATIFDTFGYFYGYRPSTGAGGASA